MLGLNTSETTDFVAFDVRLHLHMSMCGILTHSVILFHTVPRFLRLARLAHASYSPRYYIKVNNLVFLACAALCEASLPLPLIQSLYC